MTLQPTLSRDVLTDVDMANAILLDRVENRRVFAEAFMDQDVSGVRNDRYGFEVEDGELDNVEIDVVAEGSELPQRSGGTRRVEVTRHKYAESYSISMEAGLDDAVGETAIEADRKARRLGNTIDRVAFETMKSAVAGNDNETISPTGDNGQLAYGDLVDAISEAASSADGVYQPNAVFVDAQGLADVRKMDEFTHATQEGDSVITTGRIGRIAGLADIYVSNSPHVSLGSGNAFVVDTDYFGREAVWVPPTTRRGDDFATQTDVIMQLYTLFGFTDVYPNAAARIGGGGA